MGQFTVDLTRFRLKTEEQIRQVVVKIAMDLFSLVVTRAPVDTGRFRANNQISLNELPGDAVLEFDKDGGATISRGADKVAAYKLGDTIFLYNNVAYAWALEYGHSGQAPQGVYRISLKEIVDHINSARGAS